MKLASYANPPVPDGSTLVVAVNNTPTLAPNVIVLLETICGVLNRYVPTPPVPVKNPVIVVFATTVELAVPVPVPTPVAVNVLPTDG